MNQLTDLFDNAILAMQRSDYEQADALLTQAATISPENPKISFLKGLNRFEQRSYVSAEKHLEASVLLGLRDPEAFYYLATAQTKNNKPDEATNTLRQALALHHPHEISAEQSARFGETFYQCGAYADCALCLESSALTEHDASLLNIIGSAYSKLSKPERAETCYEEAITLDPENAELYKNLAAVKLQLRDLAAVLENLDKARTLDHSFFDPISMSLFAGSLLDFEKQDELRNAALHEIASKDLRMQPFGMVMLTDSAEIFLNANKLFTEKNKSENQIKISRSYRPQTHQKIRLGYLSSDYKKHATTYLINRLIQKHDRDHFEVFGLDYSINDNSREREEVLSQFDEWVDISRLADADAANRIAACDIDILIDLKGYTEGARPGIVNRRPAPIQINYLGHPGTTGNDNYDYIIGDTVVTPHEHQPFYTEKIIQLDCCYQPNDPERSVGPQRDKQDCGLPSDAFIFGCFNHHWKYNAGLLDLWRYILDQCPDSILWVLQPMSGVDIASKLNQFGIARSRIVVAKPLPVADHLARIHHIDLFLDTFPCGAHTTASDAIFCGVPVLHQIGEAFHTRVSASIMQHAEIKSLTAQSDSEYSQLAVEFYKNTNAQANYRQSLLNFEAETHPYNIKKFVASLEAALNETVSKFHF